MTSCTSSHSSSSPKFSPSSCASMSAVMRSAGTSSPAWIMRLLSWITGSTSVRMSSRAAFILRTLGSPTAFMARSSGSGVRKTRPIISMLSLIASTSWLASASSRALPITSLRVWLQPPKSKLKAARPTKSRVSRCMSVAASTTISPSGIISQESTMCDALEDAVPAKSLRMLVFWNGGLHMARCFWLYLPVDPRMPLPSVMYEYTSGRYLSM
mmetsp:Transcript_72437/g.228343  ORF Transcript_72437/g.228343 Transcript_72437/m.228343 type:complete len:213 (-) Transcript_72437:669-1307(-)